MSFDLVTRTGAFTWADLGADDAAKAQSFYGELFDWDFERVPGPGNYAFAKLDGHPVAAVYERDDKVPPELVPMWLDYAKVADADAALAKAVDLGGKDVMGVHEIPHAGRMAIVVDPEGALFAIWEARGSEGTELVDEPGTPTWRSRVTRDFDATAAFYSQLFDWEIVGVETETGRFALAECDGQPVASFEEAGADGAFDAARSWTTWFAVDDPDATAARVAETGGVIVSPAADFPWGRRAVVRDPFGVTFVVVRPMGG